MNEGTPHHATIRTFCFESNIPRLVNTSKADGTVPEKVLLLRERIISSCKFENDSDSVPEKDANDRSNATKFVSRNKSDGRVPPTCVLKTVSSSMFDHLDTFAVSWPTRPSFPPNRS
jgi:hypothetical protein